jgi:hypothetical protein
MPGRRSRRTRPVVVLARCPRIDGVPRCRDLDVTADISAIVESGCPGRRVARAGALVAPRAGMKPATSCVPIEHEDHDGPIELVPEIMVPAQFDDLRRSGVVTRPEHRLMLAVLEDAVHIYQIGGRGDGRTRRLYAETERWFASTDTSWPFSFVRICQVLGLDPEYVLSGLRRWRVAREADRTTSRPPPMRLRRVSGSRHRVTLKRRVRGSQAGAADQ